VGRKVDFKSTGLESFGLEPRDVQLFTANRRTQVAQKKRKKKSSWLKTLLFVILTPLIIWGLAFVLWFYWKDITGLTGREDKNPATKANRQVDRPTPPPDKASRERINEEDRRKLEEILKDRK